ncbi:Clavaminate synthase-like protein [Saccharata proteae CBS 121410]|uniref:Clavaminate synthase-like protein n=1 Tax=Saccharata proteae CBS 121410 TaxID=1314787 RepID=A0A9P4LWT3_9PEZI|nr:Clavaminate synthase-like protein [Saccharata proteae CBS 121410]
MRHVSLNRPFIHRRGAADWPALTKWTPTYLTTVMGTSPVNVAITPHGNADAVVTTEDGEKLFVKPFEREEPFSALMEAVREQEFRVQRGGKKGNVRYGQTQNDNLRHEFATLLSDVPPSIPTARIALQKEPDAINLWLGNSASVTAPHKDSYENVYVQVLGRKHFTLLPPVAAACVAEADLPAATYKPVVGRDPLDLVPVLDHPPESVPCVTWNPDDPATSAAATPFSSLVPPLRVTLEPGDMLYLPALWYHGVAQSCGDEGVCVAVNYWYDMEFAGSFWSMANFVRGVSNAVTKQPTARRGAAERAEDAEAEK